MLRRTSNINGRSYVPFMQADYNEPFNYPLPFNDKDGLLSLSLKQRSTFARWVRPSELSEEPRMVVQMSCYTIRQTIVSDCSLVASLAITAQYERRFKKRLISSIIYPQNKQGQPIINPSGKYMVKLHLNGVVRKVIIDDCLPLSKDGRLLCSFSINPHEMWVSLLEKAYLKVMGGYDFPGSNSVRAFIHSSSILHPSFIHPSSILHPSFIHFLFILKPFFVYPLFILHPSFFHHSSIFHSFIIHSFNLHSFIIHSFSHPLFIFYPSFIHFSSILHSFIHPSSCTEHRLALVDWLDSREDGHE